MTELKLQKVGKTFGDFKALQELDLEIRSGELISLLGPSGCGKTTTLRLISGLDIPSEGRIYFNGEDVADRAVQARNVGMVFQRYALFPHMNVEQNVSFGLRVRKTQKDEIKQRVDEILNIVQLTEFRHRFPAQLSGGQMQRVALARTLITNPSILMMDEPLANLDANLRIELRSFIRNLQQKLGITTIFVTHDQIEAMELSDRIAVMLSGRIAQFDTPANIYHRPASLEVARFIGAPNIFTGRLLINGSKVSLETSYGLLSLTDTGGRNDGEIVDAMIRPEAVVLTNTDADGPNVMSGRIVSSDFFGQATSYVVKLNGTTLRVDEMSNRRMPVGELVQVNLISENIWIFPDELITENAAENE